MNYAIKKGVGVDVKDVKKDFKILNPGKYYEDYVNKVKKVEFEFNSILKEHNKKRVVIFIDNLDRCLPDQVVDLIEDISAHFYSKNCIFVLAMDKQHVISAIEQKYPGFQGIQYLEKIVQFGLSMPKPYLRQKEGVLSWGAYHFMRRYDEAKGHEQELKSLDGRDKFHTELTSTVSQLFTQGILSNPRRAERMIFKLVLLEKMEGITLEENRENSAWYLLIWVLKEYFFEVFESLKTVNDYGDLWIFIESSESVEHTPEILKKNMDMTKRRIKFKNQIIYQYYVSNSLFYELLQIFKKVKDVKFKSREDFCPRFRLFSHEIKLIE